MISAVVLHPFYSIIFYLEISNTAENNRNCLVTVTTNAIHILLTFRIIPSLVGDYIKLKDETSFSHSLTQRTINRSRSLVAPLQ